MAETTVGDNPHAIAAVSLSVILILAFGALAVAVTRIHQRRNPGKVLTAEEFVTARGSSGKWAIAWSFYASAVGSWIISGTADFAYWSGVLGCAMYAVSAGIPIIMIGYLGNAVQRRFPRVLSLSDFARLRYGKATQVLVVLVSLFNMAVASTAEYTTIASLFSNYVGLGDFDIIMVILLGIVTLSYTTLGGLRVSIITDQAQAMASVGFFLTISIYLLATFRPDGGAIYDPERLNSTELDDQLLGKSVYGYSSIFTMPLSLVTATVFSEAMWQRVWASENESVVRFGSWIAALMITVVVFVIGFTGILAPWAGVDANIEDPNLRVWLVLQPLDEPFATEVSSAIGVIVLLFAITMSESAIDSLQNGLSASVNGAISHLIPSYSLATSRVIVLLLNIPLIIIGSFKLSVISLFLVTNMLCTTAAFPIVLGLSRHPIIENHLHDWLPPASFVISLFILVGYGTSDVSDSSLSAGENFINGIKMAFYLNGYTWDYFAVALGASVGSTAVLLAGASVFCAPSPPAEWSKADEAGEGDDGEDDDKVVSQEDPEVAATSAADDDDEVEADADADVDDASDVAPESSKASN